MLQQRVADGCALRDGGPGREVSDEAEGWGMRRPAASTARGCFTTWGSWASRARSWTSRAPCPPPSGARWSATRCTRARSSRGYRRSLSCVARSSSPTPCLPSPAHPEQSLPSSSRHPPARCRNRPSHCDRPWGPGLNSTRGLPYSRGSACRARLCLQARYGVAGWVHTRHRHANRRCSITAR